jgi:hypothetical protein
MITTTIPARDVQIETIHDREDLRRALRTLGSHYLDADTAAFFRARIAALWTTVDGAIWVETLSADMRHTRRTAKAMRLRIGAQHAQGWTIETIYAGMEDDCTAQTATRRATDRARAAVIAARAPTTTTHADSIEEAR